MVKRLKREESILMIVDVQERLVPAIHEAAQVVHACVVLAQAAQLLKIPLIVTEQYPEKLGATMPEIVGVVNNYLPISKKQFSAYTPEVIDILKKNSARNSVLLCGVEAHVCVQQTALDLLANDFDVFVVRDAISSRIVANAEIGWKRMIGAGAVPVSVESALFELLQTADSTEFKAIHQLIK
ncbi:MAG: isochorismatase family protein [Abditibacteriaceae bacterium]